MLNRKTPLKRSTKRIRPVSAKRVKENRVYSRLRKRFLEEHPYCQWWLAENGVSEADVKPNGRVLLKVWRGGDDLELEFHVVPSSTDIHHKRGRGKYLLDTSTWMAVSREGHNHIHHNTGEAYAKGYMLPR